VSTTTADTPSGSPDTAAGDPAEAPVRSPLRNAALDGLRGITILLVVLNHAGGHLWNRGAIDDIPILRGFFGSGVVVVFFVVGAFIVTKNLVRDRDRGRMDPFLFYARRLVRLGVHLLPLAAAIVALHWFDSSDPYSDAATRGSVLSMLTFSLNDYASRYLLATRADLGHLWYLSVQQQCYLLLPLVLAVFARRRRMLVVLLCVTMVAVVVWRFHTLETRGWVVASLLTSTRSDSLIWGVVLALLLPWFATRRRWAEWGVVASGAVQVVLLAILQELPAFQFLRQWSIAFTFFAGVLVLAIHLATRQTLTLRFLSVAPLAWLGRASLSIFVWHLPVILFIEGHTASWSWPARTLAALAVVAAIAVFSERYLDGPVRRWLQTNLRAREPETVR
jgi:peptidoglycan/LPS O-acetylase OafA/YrhL